MLKKILISLFLYSIGQTSYSQRMQFNLPEDRKVIIFDETEPDDLYVDDYTARFEKRYLKEFFKNEISPDLAQFGYSKKRIASMYSRLSRTFKDVFEDEYLYYNRYSKRSERGYIDLQSESLEAFLNRPTSIYGQSNLRILR